LAQNCDSIGNDFRLLATQNKILKLCNDRHIENVIIIKDNSDMLVVISPKIVTNKQHHEMVSVIEKYSYSADDNLLVGKVH